MQVFYNAMTQSHILAHLVDLSKVDDQIAYLEYEGTWTAPVLNAVRQETFGKSAFAKQPQA